MERANSKNIERTNYKNIDKTNYKKIFKVKMTKNIELTNDDRTNNRNIEGTM